MAHCPKNGNDGDTAGYRRFFASAFARNRRLPLGNIADWASFLVENTLVSNISSHHEGVSFMPRVLPAVMMFAAIIFTTTGCRMPADRLDYCGPVYRGGTYPPCAQDVRAGSILSPSGGQAMQTTPSTPAEDTDRSGSQSELEPTPAPPESSPSPSQSPSEPQSSPEWHSPQPQSSSPSPSPFVPEQTRQPASGDGWTARHTDDSAAK